MNDECSECDPICFPLFFPHGDAGWSYGIKHSKIANPKGYNQTTINEYYAYRISYRKDYSSLFFGRKLFQQFILAAYIKCENNRLKFLTTKLKM